MTHGRMEYWGEHEADARPFDAPGNPLRGKLYSYSQGLQDVGAAASARRGPVAVFGNLEAGGSGDEGGGGGNIEGILSVSSGANGVDQWAVDLYLKGNSRITEAIPAISWVVSP